MPLILQEDESKKLGKKQFVLPPDLSNYLKSLGQVYSGNEYKKNKGYQRLQAIINKGYNDPAKNKEKNHSDNLSLTFYGAKRIERDMRYMPQTKDNLEYQMIGGDRMKNWLKSALKASRNAVHQVDAVPQVAKLDTKDIKVQEPKQIKLNGTEITLENKSFKDNIKKLFQ